VWCVCVCVVCVCACTYLLCVGAPFVWVCCFVSQVKMGILDSLKFLDRYVFAHNVNASGTNHLPTTCPTLTHACTLSRPRSLSCFLRFVCALVPSLVLLLLSPLSRVFFLLYAEGKCQLAVMTRWAAGEPYSSTRAWVEGGW